MYRRAKKELEELQGVEKLYYISFLTPPLAFLAFEAGNVVVFKTTASSHSSPSSAFTL